MSQFLKDRVAVLIVTYNALDSVQECLSKLAWIKDEQDVKIFVYDNSEQRMVYDFIKKSFPWVQIEKGEKNLGFGAAMNEAYRMAKDFDPRFLMLINPDLLIEKSSFVRLLERMSRVQDSVGIIGPKILNNGKKIERSILPRYSIFNISLIILSELMGFNIREKIFRANYDREGSVNAISGACMLIRREMVDEIGLFDSKFFMYYEDNELCLRARRSGWEVWFTPAVEVFHYLGKSSERLPNQGLWLKEQMYRSLLILFNKHNGKVETALLRKLWIAGFYLRIALRKDVEWSHKMIGELKNFKLN